MIRNVGSSDEKFLVDLFRIQSAAERAQREISSGLRVTAPSDAPDQVGDILQLRTDIERNDQLRTNLSRIKVEVDTAEDALQSAIQLVDRARTLASQSAGTTETADNRRIVAGEVQGLLERLVSDSRTLVEGRYVFSGDQDTSPSYELNLSAPDGVTRLQTASASRQIEHPNGTVFSAALTSQEIFDDRNADDTPAPGNVFVAMNSLRVALENNDQAGIDASLASLREAGDHLNLKLGIYGNVQTKIQDAIDSASKLDVQLSVELSQKRDADVTSAILELQRARTHEDAALQARANLPNTSLFDFLK